MLTVYGADWCADCRRTKSLLKRLGIEHDYIDVEHDDAAREKSVELSGAERIPVVVFDDGTILVEPSDPQMRRQLGL